MNEEPWHFTVVCAKGLRLMRRERSWQPIVTVEVDKHHQHEVVLGVDGQNPNLKKECFRFHEYKINSLVELHVWRRSQSKKKGKKRTLVASASHTLAELIKKQELDPHIEVRLQCQDPGKHAVSSRGRPQNGAIILLKIRPPSALHLSSEPTNLLSEPSGWSSQSYPSSNSGSSDQESDTPPPSTPPQKLRRRRVRGFQINSEDEIFSTEDENDQHPKPFFDDSNCDYDYEDDNTICEGNLAIITSPEAVIKFQSTNPLSWVAASVLPQYTEKIETPSSLTRPEAVVATFTMYHELKEAQLDSHYEKVFHRLQMEWTYIGGLLVALAAVDTAVFSISPGSIFTVDPYARSAIAASSIASGLGIACDAWFLLRYSWADISTFITRARDVYGSYFFFSISARVPALCMFVSAVSLMGFLGLVAFGAWPEGVIVVCFLVGVVMSLQFLVFGVHWCASLVAQGGRAGTRGVVSAVRRMTG